MKVAGNSKRKNVFQTDNQSVTEQEADSNSTILRQLKLDDLEQERLEVKTKTTAEKKTTAKKPAEKKSTATAKAAEEKMTEVTTTEETVQQPEAAAEEKTKAAEVKKETKTTGKTTKTTAKKETKAAEKVSVSEKIVLQINGREDLAMSNLIDRVKAAYVAEGHEEDSIKNIEVYIKLDENMAYYVIDEYASGISLY